MERGKGLKVPLKGDSRRYIGKERLEFCKQTSFGSSPLGLCYKPSHLNGWENNELFLSSPLMKVDGLGPRVCFWATLQTLVWQS